MMIAIVGLGNARLNHRVLAGELPARHAGDEGFKVENLWLEARFEHPLLADSGPPQQAEIGQKSSLEKLCSGRRLLLAKVNFRSGSAIKDS